MNQCYLFVQHAAQNFPAEQVTSPHVHIILRYLYPVFILLGLYYISSQTSLYDMIHEPTEDWNIAQEIVHLLWAYGQNGHRLRKSDLQKWDGNKFFMTFWRLDEDAKGFQVICYRVFFLIYKLIPLLCQHNHLLSQRLWMMDSTKNGHLSSSFAYPLHQTSKSSASFTASLNILNEVDTRWLIDTSNNAARLVAQRSNVELLCLFTCLNKAKALEIAGKDGPHDGNAEWIQNINQWARINKTLAVQSGYICAYFQKYGFALYHNVANDRFVVPLDK